VPREAAENSEGKPDGQEQPAPSQMRWQQSKEMKNEKPVTGNRK
jgi:hypothetical protein